MRLGLPRLLPLAAALGLSLVPAHRAFPEPNPSMGVLDGMLRGTTLSPSEGFFKYKSRETRWGVLGTLTGSSRDFEEIELEVGGDRTVFGSGVRAVYEGQRIRLDVKRGQEAKVDAKGDLCVTRIKGFTGDWVYACATKQLGRTVLFVRGDCEGKKEAGLVKILVSAVASAKTTADEVDGWLPPEVKVAWNRTPSADMLLLDDGKVPEDQREAILKVVRDAHAFVKRSLSASYATNFPPTVRLTGSRDLLQHLAQRRDLSTEDAAYVAYAGELVIAPRSAKVDPGSIARAAVRQACHHVLAGAAAEPIVTGLSRLAEAIALGAPAGSLVPADEERAFTAIKAKSVRTWGTILKTTASFKGFFDGDSGERALEAELLSAGYLAGSGAPQAKASLSKWVEGMKKTGNEDAASEAAYAPLDPAKSDAEYWAYWTTRAEPPKKPGDKGSTKPKGK